MTKKELNKKEEGNPYIEKLDNLGFSKAEALIYVYLLEKGKATGVSKIAIGISMHRQQVYITLPLLVEAGIVEEIKEGKISKYKARPPHILERVVRRKMSVAEDLVQELQKISKIDNEQDFEIIVGVKAFQDYEIERAKNMKEGEEQYIIGTEKNEYLEVMSEIYKSKYEPILEKKKIVTYYLAPKLQDWRTNLIDSKQKFYLKVLNNLTTGPLATMIQGDSLMFYVNVNPATIYVIKSKKVAEGYKQFFMMLWEMASL